MKMDFSAVEKSRLLLPVRARPAAPAIAVPAAGLIKQQFYLPCIPMSGFSQYQL